MREQFPFERESFEADTKSFAQSGRWFREGNRIILLAENDNASEISEAPHVNFQLPKDVIDPRIDVGAQQSLLRMFKGDPVARTDAARMLAAVKSSQLSGIYGDDLLAAVKVAQRLNTQRWLLVPKSEDAALVLDPAGPPAIIFRGDTPNIRSTPSRIDPALRKASLTFQLLRTGQMTTSACSAAANGRSFNAAVTPVSNLVPPILCTIDPRRTPLPDVPVSTLCCSQIKTVSVWVNAFIPGNHPGLTKEVTVGQHAGKTMIDDTDVNSLLTDQRDFDPDPQAASRFHSRIDVDLPSGAFTQTHRADRSIAILRKTGMVSCGFRPDKSRMKFGNLKREDILNGLVSVITVDVKIQYRDPCTVTPFLILFDGTIRIEFMPKYLIFAEVSFSGRKRQFPAFEMYATANNNQGVTLFRRTIRQGVTLHSEPQSFRVRGRTHLICDPQACQEGSQEQPAISRSITLGRRR